MKSTTYKNYTIEPWSKGFQVLPGTLTAISSFIVKKEEFASGFAFAMGMLDRMAYSYIKDEDINEKIDDIIKTAIDSGKMGNLEEYTFEFHTGQFYQIKNPKWWIKSGK